MVAHPIMQAGRGAAQFAITWTSGQFGGNQPDAGAVCLLIPSSLSKKLPSSAINPETAEIWLDDTRKVLSPSGVYISIVGGDGIATMENVMPGSYHVVILSKNTRDDAEGQQKSQTELEKYFDEDTASTSTKAFFSETQIVAGQSTQVTHDFGNSSL